MINAVRSELIRTRRKGVLSAWLGLTALFAVMMYFAIFSFVDSAEGVPENGPGVTFPSLDTLTSPEGMLSPLASASSMFGLVALAFWALCVATDYSTGMIRLLTAAQPRRWKLLAGKIIALLLWTAVAATVAMAATVFVAPIASAGTSLNLSAWQDITALAFIEAWLNIFLAMTVWGMLGLLLATLTRSAAVAISVGAGWVLLIESVVTVIVPEIAQWLPGTTISAIASGGSASLNYGEALALGGVYVLICVAISTVVYSRRDVTD